MKRRISKRWQREKPQVKLRAKQLRELLIKELGGACWECNSTQRLHLDHPRGKTWQPREKNCMQRIRLYWRDFNDRNLRLLCEHCNCSDGARRGNAKRFPDAPTNGPDLCAVQADVEALF